jgi:phosphoserine aminotransferase
MLNTPATYTWYLVGLVLQWLKDEKAEAITELCNRIKCPKKYEQLAKLVNKTYQFATNFDIQ